MQNKKIKFTKTNLEKLPHPEHDQREKMKSICNNFLFPFYFHC